MGSFDGVHKGHQHFLQQLVDLAHVKNKESVLLTFWAHPRVVLQPHKKLFLLSTLDERIRLLEKTGIQHLIILPFTKELAAYTSCDFLNKILINSLKISTLLLGFNHTFGRNGERNIDKLQACSGKQNLEIKRIEALQQNEIKISSTKIREALQSGDIATANSYLGYSYSIEGEVVSGKQIGNSIGFPTSNIQLSESYKLIPAKGVYAVWVHYRQKKYAGMLNIGTRPTFEDGRNEQSIEVHILDFEKQIYGENLHLTFVKKIRDEQKFTSIELLIRQLEKDRETVLKITL